MDMGEKPRRWRCLECDWQGGNDDLLAAEHPFQHDTKIAGCPQCREVGCFVALCDEPGCEQEVSCGWSSGDSYRNTCGKHAQWNR